MGICIGIFMGLTINMGKHGICMNVIKYHHGILNNIQWWIVQINMVIYMGLTMVYVIIYGESSLMVSISRNDNTV